MQKSPKISIRSGWKVLVVMVMVGYTMSSLMTYEVAAAQLVIPQTTQTPSFQQEIETNVAGLAQWVWEGLVSFMQKGMPKAKDALPSIPSILPQNEQVQKSDLSSEIILNPQPKPVSENQTLSVFSDIAQDPNRQSIEILANIGLLSKGNGGKFYPHNYVRCADFIRVMLDLYRQKLWYHSDDQNGYVNIAYFVTNIQDSFLLKKLNTAHALGLLEWLGEIGLEKPISPKQALQIINNTLNLNPSFGSKEIKNQISFSGEALTKSQMAQMLVAIFQLEKSIVNKIFNDIGNHRYQDSIMRLAQLGVVAGNNGNFYPDAMALREDAVIMIANSLALSQSKPLVIKNFTHLSSINDTTYFASYAPYLEYLLANEIWDFLLHPQSTGYVFVPHAMLTKWEAYTLISQAARVKLLNLDAGVTSQPITRGELADLLVQAFWFMSTKKSETTIPTPVPVISGTNNQYIALREEKKGVLVSFLKDILDAI